MQVETRYQQFLESVFPYCQAYQSLYTFTTDILNPRSYHLELSLIGLSLINIYMPAECDCNRSYPGRGAIHIQSSFGIFSQVTLFYKANKYSAHMASMI